MPLGDGLKHKPSMAAGGNDEGKDDLGVVSRSMRFM